MRAETMKSLTTGLLAVWLVGCGGDPFRPGAVEEIESLPRDLSRAEQSLIAADNAFGLRLFREVVEQDGGGNVFISPLSVAMALGMTYNGAAGATRDSMQAALALEGLSLVEVNESYRDLIDLLVGLDPSVEFLLANSIWLREGFPAEASFLETNREYFDAQVAALDFDAPSAVPTINGWVSDQTNGRIDTIVEPPIDASTVMFLINAIYFNGSWTARFDPDLTRDGTFRLAAGGEKRVRMMSHSEPIELRQYGDGQLQAIDLTYGGKAYSMTILLPRQASGTMDLVASLDADRWEAIVSGLGGSEAMVVMPKFRLEYELELQDALTALGMGVAFDPNRADFSNIFAGPPNLFISRVKHKTFVDVNEEGTEAAAVTGVEVGVTSAPSTIVIDRPFVFAIREKFSGTILFIGLVMDPSSAG